MDFTALYASMTPGSQYTTYVPLSASAAFLADLQRALKIAGFMEYQQQTLTAKQADGAAQPSTAPMSEAVYLIQATRPAFEQGASFSIAGRMRQRKPAAASAEKNKPVAQGLNGAGGSSSAAGSATTAEASNDDDDLIDEDTLLDELDKQKPSLDSLQRLPFVSC